MEANQELEMLKADVTIVNDATQLCLYPIPYELEFRSKSTVSHTEINGTAVGCDEVLSWVVLLAKCCT